MPGKEGYTEQQDSTTSSSTPAVAAAVAQKPVEPKEDPPQGKNLTCAEKVCEVISVLGCVISCLTFVCWIVAFALLGHLPKRLEWVWIVLFCAPPGMGIALVCFMWLFFMVSGLCK